MPPCAPPPATAQPAPSAHSPTRPGPHPATRPGGMHQLARGISAFQQHTAPLVRGELARLARDGQRPAQLFLTCADSRLVTSMITSSGPGDLFVVRNIGNLVPLPGEERGDDSVAAAIEYAVEVLKVRSITVCGHSGCGAMQALVTMTAATGPRAPEGPGTARTPLERWLQYALPSLAAARSGGTSGVRIAGRAPADLVEKLCLTNVVQQLEHLRTHAPVARGLAAGTLGLHGMYFHVAEAQAYLLTGDGAVFDQVTPAAHGTPPAPPPVRARPAVNRIADAYPGPRTPPGRPAQAPAVSTPRPAPSGPE